MQQLMEIYKYGEEVLKQKGSTIKQIPLANGSNALKGS